MRQRAKFGEETKIEPVAPPRPTQTLEMWVTDVCKVKDCYDGFLSREINGYSTVFACPACERYNRDLIGFGGAELTAIPTAKKWLGKVEMYTYGEMEGIISRRREVARSLRDRAARKVDWHKAVEKIGEIDDGPF